MYIQGPPITTGQLPNANKLFYPTDSASTPPKDPANISLRIHTALNYTDELAAGLNKLISELEMRLSHVLSPAGPDNDSSSGTLWPTSNSPLTERIANVNNRLISASDVIYNLLKRLEL
jgi:hypothetical protein